MASLLIDSHFHSTYLDSQDFGIDAGIDIGTRCNDLPERYEKLKGRKEIFLSAAMGPWECGKSSTREDTDDSTYTFRTDEEIRADFETLEYNIEKYNPFFIGECGLDYYWMYGTRSQQIDLFENHLILANKLSKPVIIHNREADSDTRNLITVYRPVKGGIIHCFSGDADLMKTALDNGFYISFAGNLTYKKNTELRERLKEVPKDRLLLETDSPYLTPVPFRGQKNSPDKVKYTYLCASEIIGITFEELEEIITDNFTRLCKKA